MAKASESHPASLFKPRPDGHSLLAMAAAAVSDQKPKTVTPFNPLFTLAKAASQESLIKP